MFQICEWVGGRGWRVDGWVSRRRALPAINLSTESGAVLPAGDRDAQDKSRWSLAAPSILISTPQWQRPF